MEARSGILVIPRFVADRPGLLWSKILRGSIIAFVTGRESHPLIGQRLLSPFSSLLFSKADQVIGFGD
jgi:hypothetical protein